MHSMLKGSFMISIRFLPGDMAAVEVSPSLSSACCSWHYSWLHAVGPTRHVTSGWATDTRFCSCAVAIHATRTASREGEGTIRGKCGLLIFRSCCFCAKEWTFQHSYDYEAFLPYTKSSTSQLKRKRPGLCQGAPTLFSERREHSWQHVCPLRSMSIIFAWTAIRWKQFWIVWISWDLLLLG